MPASHPQSFWKSDIGILTGFGLATAIFHALTNGQYGFHRDELDILMNARSLQWGYVAYPPLTPLIARIGLALFGPSLIGLRLFPAIGQGIAVTLVGLMARDMGGRRAAQLTAAAAAAIAPVALVTGTLMQYMSFDFLWWVVIAFFTVRLLKTENPRYWLGIGAGIGLGMMTKYTLVFFVFGLVVGVLLTGTRRYLRSPWLWAGAGLALLICLPNLIWQAQHSFVSLDFLKAIHARDIQWGRTKGYLPEQLYVPANPVTLPLWIAGLHFLLFTQQGRRFRTLAWMYLTTLVLLFASQGRSYYLAPAYPMLLAAGAVWLECWLERQPEGRARVVQETVRWALVIGGIFAILTSKPVSPVNSAPFKLAGQFSDNFVEMIGWQDLTAKVAKIYAGLPESDKAQAAVLAGNYGEAGALKLYGPEYGLPRVITGANSQWYEGYGDPAPETVIVVGFERQYAERFFKSCQAQGIVDNAYQIMNEESSRHNILYVCRGPRKPWAEMWAGMRWFQ